MSNLANINSRLRTPKIRKYCHYLNSLFVSFKSQLMVKLNLYAFSTVTWNQTEVRNLEKIESSESNNSIFFINLEKTMTDSFALEIQILGQANPINVKIYFWRKDSRMHITISIQKKEGHFYIMMKMVNYLMKDLTEFWLIREMLLRHLSKLIMWM